MEHAIRTICQSCAMPLSQDPMGSGTEADGTPNADYCSYCYRNGEFTDSTLTLGGMVARLEPIMASLDLSPEVIQMTIATLPQLKRWNRHPEAVSKSADHLVL